jgi:hypothetical protein
MLLRFLLPRPPLEPNSPKEPFFSISDAETQIEYAFKIYNREEERKKASDAKATNIIGLLTIIATILSTGDFLKHGSGIIINLVKFILIVYAFFSIFYAIKSLQVRAYHTLSIEDITKFGTDFKKEIAEKILKYTFYNYEITNRKITFIDYSLKYLARTSYLILIYIFSIHLF